MQPSFAASAPLSGTFRPRPRVSSVRCSPPSAPHLVFRVRCSMMDKSVEQGDQPVATDDALNASEGAMDSALPDALLEAALDRSWDSLSLFGGDPLKPVAEDDETKLSSTKSSSDVQTAESGAQENAAAAKSDTEIVAVEPSTTTTTTTAAAMSETSEALLSSPEVLLEDGTYEARESVDIVAAMDAVFTDKKKGRKKRATKSAVERESAKQLKIQKREAVKAAREKLKKEKAEMKAQESQDKANAAQWHCTPQWYFLQVKPGCEQSCAMSLRNLSKSMPQLHIKEVMVPVMEILRLAKGGRAVKKEERIYPSYILIHMSLDYQSYSQVQSVPNVQFFMGDPNRDKKRDQPFMPPLPVSGKELRNVFERMRTAEKAKPEAKTVLRPGNKVDVLGGEHEEKIATIIAVRPDINCVTVELRAFARVVQVELPISQVRKRGETEEEDEEEEEVEALQVGEDIEAEDSGGFVEVEVETEKEEKVDRVATVLDALEEVPGSVAPNDFTDLLDDNDLPDYPMPFNPPSNPRRRSAEDSA